MTNIPDHYGTLGLSRRATAEEVRIAFRVLARKFHPDLNPNSPEAIRKTQDLNAAYETLTDPQLRRDYDRDLDAARGPSTGSSRSGRIERDIKQDMRLNLADFIQGTNLQVRVNDPSNPDGPECYDLEIPADTAPKEKFRIPRAGAMTGGNVIVRLIAMPSSRFKVSGSDLKTELRIQSALAANGGSERIQSVSGRMIFVEIPSGVQRGEVIRVPREGLPKPRGGRGDLLVKITFRPEVRITKR